MQRVLIVGAGGHGQVVADILMRTPEAGDGKLRAIGYIDDDTSLHGETLLGLPVLGRVADLATIPHDAVVVAVGDNRTRQELFNRLKEQEESFVIARHPSSVVGPDVIIGPGTMICAGVVINPGSVIGQNTILNTGCTIDHHNQIGDHVHIAPGVTLGGEVVVDEGALVGIGATVMPGRRVGPWSVIGAGALVQRDVPGGVTAVGLPAKVVEEWNR